MNYSGALSPPSSTSSIVPLAPAGMIPIAYDSQWSILNGVGQTVNFRAVTAKISVASNARTTRTVASCTAADYCIDSTLPAVPDHAGPVTAVVPNARRLAIRHCRLQLSQPHKAGATRRSPALDNLLAEHGLLPGAPRQSELRRPVLCIVPAARPSTGAKGAVVVRRSKHHQCADRRNVLPSKELRERAASRHYSCG